MLFIAATPVTRNFILTLSIGVTFGFVFAFMFLNGSKYNTYEFTLKGPPPAANDLQNGLEVSQHSPEEWTHRGEASLAEEMARKVKVACWVMTMPDNHDKKAKHVKATWGRRCNILVFMSSEAGESFY